MDSTQHSEGSIIATQHANGNNRGKGRDMEHNKDENDSLATEKALGGVAVEEIFDEPVDAAAAASAVQAIDGGQAVDVEEFDYPQLPPSDDLAAVEEIHEVVEELHDTTTTFVIPMLTFPTIFEKGSALSVFESTHTTSFAQSTIVHPYDYLPQDDENERWGARAHYDAINSIIFRLRRNASGSYTVPSSVIKDIFIWTTHFSLWCPLFKVPRVVAHHLELYSRNMPEILQGNKCRSIKMDKMCSEDCCRAHGNHYIGDHSRGHMAFAQAVGVQKHPAKDECFPAEDRGLYNHYIQEHRGEEPIGQHASVQFRLGGLYTFTNICPQQKNGFNNTLVAGFETLIIDNLRYFKRSSVLVFPIYESELDKTKINWHRDITVIGSSTGISVPHKIGIAILCCEARQVVIKIDSPQLDNLIQSTLATHNWEKRNDSMPRLKLGSYASGAYVLDNKAHTTAMDTRHYEVEWSDLESLTGETIPEGYKKQPRLSDVLSTAPVCGDCKEPRNTNEDLRQAEAQLTIATRELTRRREAYQEGMTRFFATSMEVVRRGVEVPHLKMQRAMNTLVDDLLLKAHETTDANFLIHRPIVSDPAAVKAAIALAAAEKLSKTTASTSGNNTAPVPQATSSTSPAPCAPAATDALSLPEEPFVNFHS